MPRKKRSFRASDYKLQYSSPDKLPDRVVAMPGGKYAVRLPSRNQTVLANDLRQALALNTSEDIIQASRQIQAR